MLKLNGRTCLTLREAEKIFGVGISTLIRALRMGRLHPVAKVGKAVLVDAKEVNAWKREYYSERHAAAVRRRWAKASGTQRKGKTLKKTKRT
jgi:predicted site-specific integrase-resolvase